MRPFGKYQLIRRLAAGGMAEVYLATGPNPRNAELVAIKLILQAFAEDEGFMKMFLTEARLAAPLHHPNLVEIFDLGMADEQLYLAMEYIAGKSLSHLRRRAQEVARQAPGDPTTPRITPRLAAALVRQAAAGLHHAHEARSPTGEPLGLVHRDISPQNLILGGDGVVKVVDFGVAKATAVADVSRAGSLKGKMGYIAPEQLREGIVDRQVDVFALGAVLFELAAGRPLYQGRTEAELLRQSLKDPPPDMSTFPEIEPELGAIILQAIERDRSRRFGTAKAVEDRLAAWLGTSVSQDQVQLAGLLLALFQGIPRTFEEASGERSVDALAKPEPAVVPLANQTTAALSAPPLQPVGQQTVGERRPKEDGRPKEAANRPARDLGVTRVDPKGVSSTLITDPNPDPTIPSPTLSNPAAGGAKIPGPELAEDEPTASVSISVTRRDPRKPARVPPLAIVAIGALAAALFALAMARLRARPRRPETMSVTPVMVQPRSTPAVPVKLASAGPGSDVLDVDQGRPAVSDTPSIHAADLRAQAQKLLAAGDKRRAVEVLEQAVKTSDTDPAAHRMLAEALESRGDVDQAARHYRRFVELAPHDPDAPRVQRFLDGYDAKAHPTP